MERSRGVGLELTLKICIQLLQNGEQKHVCVLLYVCVCVYGKKTIRQCYSNFFLERKWKAQSEGNIVL